MCRCRESALNFAICPSSIICDSLTDLSFKFENRLKWSKWPKWIKSQMAYTFAECKAGEVRGGSPGKRIYRRLRFFLDI